jgi:MFS transporter, MHS family, shikimate and dehydroshikimate transport protein
MTPFVWSARMTATFSGRRTSYLAGTAFGIVLAFPIFWLFESRDLTIVTSAIVVGIALCQGVSRSSSVPTFPISGISLGLQLGAAIGGGLTPVLAAALVTWSGGATWPVSLMRVALGVVTFRAVLSARETAARPMRT